MWDTGPQDAEAEIELSGVSSPQSILIVSPLWTPVAFPDIETTSRPQRGDVLLIVVIVMEGTVIDGTYCRTRLSLESETHKLPDLSKERLVGRNRELAVGGLAKLFVVAFDCPSTIVLNFSKRLFP